MGTKLKGGFRKGFNKYISRMFVVKEEEIQIGGPTDVKHVAHIGWDGGGSGSTNPTWMNTFETGPNFAMTSVGASVSTPSTRTSQDTGGVRQQSKSLEVLVKEAPSTEVNLEPKKKRRKKKKKKSAAAAVSSPRAGGVKPKPRKSKSKLIEGKFEGNSTLHITMP